MGSSAPHTGCHDQQTHRCGVGALVGFSWRRAGARREGTPVEGGATAAVAHEDAGVAVVDSTLQRIASASLWSVSIPGSTLQ